MAPSQRRGADSFETQLCFHCFEINRFTVHRRVSRADGMCPGAVAPFEEIYKSMSHLLTACVSHSKRSRSRYCLAFGHLGLSISWTQTTQQAVHGHTKRVVREAMCSRIRLASLAYESTSMRLRGLASTSHRRERQLHMQIQPKHV